MMVVMVLMMMTMLMTELMTTMMMAFGPFEEPRWSLGAAPGITVAGGGSWNCPTGHRDLCSRPSGHRGVCACAVFTTFSGRFSKQVCKPGHMVVMMIMVMLMRVMVMVIMVIMVIMVMLVLLVMLVIMVRIFMMTCP